MSSAAISRVAAPPASCPADREALLERYLRTRRHSLHLTRSLTAEDQQVQSMPDASPTKWHLAHTTWFLETFVLAEAGVRAFDPRYAYLFNSYYEALGARQPRAERGLLTRPTLAEIASYRESVDAGMRELARTSSDALWSRLAASIELGIQHEQQHQELILMDIKHAFFANPLRPAYAPPGTDAVELTEATTSSARATSLSGVRERTSSGPMPPTIALGAGLIEIGASEHDPAFAFDNEYPRHRVWLEAHRLHSRLATVGEWLEFIADRGYERPELWLSDGWALVQREAWHAPLYWVHASEIEAGRERQTAHAGRATAAAAADPRSWSVFTLQGMRLLDPGEPVRHVSFYEADAFARWRGARLPTEAEWEHAARATYADPAASPRLEQLDGVAWQWTSSPYVAYPGFRPAAGAVGEYNGKFMSGQIVLRGSSFATPPGHARITYRNFFPPGARWAFTGVRLAHDH